MSARCQETQDRLARLEQGLRFAPAELAAHLAACADCAAEFRRSAAFEAVLIALERIPAPRALDALAADGLSPERRGLRGELALGRVLSSLPRLPAPAELDGRVVAACHAGHREDRAAAWLAVGLPPLKAPEELELRLEAELAAEARLLAAPRELELRVQAELTDPGQAAGRRLGSRLQRLPAPEELLARVGAGLDLRQPSRRHAGLALALGTLAVGMLFFVLWRADSRPQPPPLAGLERLDRPDLDFEVYRAEPGTLELSPLAQALAGGLTGGLSDLLGSGGTALAPAASRGSRSPAGPGFGGLGRPGAGSGASDSHASSGGGGPLVDASGGASRAFLDRLPQAPFEVRHSGLRRVYLRDPATGVSLELREEVWSDGQGRFAVRLRSGGPGGAMFEALHRAREGFLQRYRDFRVRDLAALLENYELELLAGERKLAGRSVVQIEAVRRVGPPVRYLAAIDPLTGLVLAYEERRGPAAELVAAVEFEALDLDPDLDAVELSGGPSEWIDFDPRHAERDLGFQARVPAYSPRSYRLERVSHRPGPLGGTWIQFVYGDGADQVFFLHAEAQAADPAAPPMDLRRGGVVRIAQVGAWTVLEGEIQRVPVAAVGKLEPDELLLLVQSAFAP